MLRCPSALLAMSVLLIATGLCAQNAELDQHLAQEAERALLRAQEAERAQPADLLARLSYESSVGASVERVCIAVSRDGEYRMVRKWPGAEMMRLQGKMPEDQLGQLTKLLESSDFRSLAGNHGGLIRQRAESFTAEIGAGEKQVAGREEIIGPRPGRVEWLNADGESPFPLPIAKVAGWLERFVPKEGKPFVYAEFPEVCPSQGLRLVQPTFAFNPQPYIR
jgi:hypothetical protein